MISKSHAGLVRLHNEDCVVCEPTLPFAVLADGMGGLLAGAQASEVAVAAVCRELRKPMSVAGDPQSLVSVLQVAHDAVAAAAKAMRYVGKMGTTLVVWAQLADTACYAYVGDSRLYVYADGHLSQVTRDHTLSQRKIQQGRLSPAQEMLSPDRHVLTQAVGLPGLFKADCGWVPAAERVLMCSDGLSDMVPAAEIEALMATPNAEDCANYLLKAALDRGGQDNVSVVVIDHP